MQNNCPSCSRSLIGEAIPETWRELVGGATHYRLDIAIVENDRCVAIECPFCRARWKE